MNRKIVISSCALLVCSLLLGCSTDGTVKRTARTGDIYAPGRYSAMERGFGGDVVVTIEVDGTKILNVTAEGKQETSGVGSRAIEQLPQRIQAANSADVDGVAGATVSSGAVLRAARAAMEKAKGKTAPAGTPNLVMRPGTYTATRKGFDSEVTVEVAVADNAFKRITILSSESVPQIFQTVKERLPERIVQAQSLNVDAIAGATVTSNAVKAAVKDCALQAGAEEAALYAPIERSAQKLEYKCDVVVIGGGTSGCSAAAMAAERGAKVILVEKTPRIGGAGSISSGFMGIGSQIQKDQGIQYSVDEVFDEWMAQHHYMVPEAGLLKTYLAETGETIDWLVSKGFRFSRVTSFDGSKQQDYHWFQLDEDIWNSIYSMTGKKFFDGLVSGVEKTGGKILYETAGKRLIIDGKGNVTGIEAERYDGAKITIRAASVILATGGFAGNEDMQKKYYGTTYRFYGMLQDRGDGILMGESAGGAILHPTATCVHFFAPYKDVAGFDKFDTDSLVSVVVTPSLLSVNRHGVRFTDESNMTKGFLISGQTHFQQGGYYFTLLTQKQLNILATQGNGGLGCKKPPFTIPFVGNSTAPDVPMPHLQAVMNAAIDQDIAYKGETLEELAQKTGMNARILKETVATYDRMCASGKDILFNKESDYMQPLGDGPYYAIKTGAVPYNTMGGLEVNAHLEVVDKEYNTINGLYAVGMESFGVLSDGTGYPNFGGPATSWALVSGRMAGREAASYAARK